MGLDMYLTARYYYGGKWKERGEETHTLDISGDFAKKNKLTAGKVQEITEEVAYWRKANQIHNWFVTNVQGGQDNCQECWVSKQQLETLVNTCKETLEALDNKDYSLAEALLPPCSGFFFGDTNVDTEWYRQDIKDTIKQIEDVLKRNTDCDFYYTSSW